jgi:hypothetical protein
MNAHDKRKKFAALAGDRFVVALQPSVGGSA